MFDVAIAGGGPAGSACAIVCAAAGLRVVVLERARFPREKVCGDCLNPAAWPILERLAVAERVRAAPHAPLRMVSFLGTSRASIQVDLPSGQMGEIAIKRSLLDDVLLTEALRQGAEVRQEQTITAVARVQGGGWEVTAGQEPIQARILVAADGRNSTVARLLGLLPPHRADRIALQTHFAVPTGMGRQVAMRFHPHGYCGVADVGQGEANLCLVSRPRDMDAARQWAEREFGLTPAQEWRSIAPLSRAAIAPAHPGLLLTGDAARVVEPFTGEGIYYALATGELAGRHIAARDLQGYAAAHARIYRGRLWINEVAKQACLHPRLADAVLTLARWQPSLLRFLTSKVTGQP